VVSPDLDEMNLPSGPAVAGVGSGFGSVVFLLVMLQTYGIVLGTAYVALDARSQNAVLFTSRASRQSREAGQLNLSIC
jgi:hypothetical protein